jgi:hypothetical protein
MVNFDHTTRFWILLIPYLKNNSKALGDLLWAVYGGCLFEHKPFD